MSAPVKPGDPDYLAWAVLWNDVTAALGVLDHWHRLTERQAVAEAMWEAGYRPTPEQIEALGRAK